MIFEYLLFMLVIILTLKTVILFEYSLINFNNKVNMNNSKNKLEKFISVVIPSYNEEITLENCIKGLIAQTHENYEIVIVDDGSKDQTLKIAYELQEKYKDKKIKVITQKNGGRSSAINLGIKNSDGEIIVCLDADSIFSKDTLHNLSNAFNNDEKLTAICGNVKVSNKDNLLTKCQALDYIGGFNITRRAFSSLNCIQIISGTLGAFKKDKLIEVGGFSPDMITEDMDLTINLATKGYKAMYLPNAIAYTEAPEDIKGFYKQRYRWDFGMFQVIRKYKSFLFSDSNNLMSLLGLPYIIIYVTCNIVITFILIGILIYSIIYENILYTLIPSILMVMTYNFIINAYSIYIDKEDLKMLWLIPIFTIYDQLINFIKIKALIDFLKGKKASWNKLERLGKNVIS